MDWIEYKDQVFLNKDQVFLNKDQIFSNKDQIFLNKDQILLNKNQIFFDKDQIFLGHYPADFDVSVISMINQYVITINQCVSTIIHQC